VSSSRKLPPPAGKKGRAAKAQAAAAAARKGAPVGTGKAGTGRAGTGSEAAGRPAKAGTASETPAGTASGAKAGTASGAKAGTASGTKAGTASGTKAGTASGTKAGTRIGGGGRRPPAGGGATAVSGMVVGPVPVAARVAGALAVGGALCRLAVPAFPIAHVRGHALGGAANLFDWLVVLPYVAVIGVAGVLVVLGRLPRLGLATIRTAGVLAAALLAQTVYLLDAGQRSTTDLSLGVGTSLRYSAGSGLVLLAVGYGLVVAALVVAEIAWPRTVMEDDGRLDRLRPRLAGWGLAAGIFAAIVLGMSPFHSSVAHLAPPAVPGRDGWDLVGGAVLALAAAVYAVIAATLQPRLAVVGGYAALAGVLATQGLATALLVARSPAITPSAGGIGTLVSALLFALLALAAWRLPTATAAAQR
jgi:iron complex transport system permease protein